MTKNIVITGASAGIGEAIAKQAAARGDRVVLAARRREELERVAASLGAQAAAIVPTDVTRRAEVERLRDQAIAALGHVDVWINNAGQGINRPVLELTDEDIDEMVRVNVKSVLYGAQAIVPHFQARNAGHLINMSSFLARVPAASPRAAYSAAKAAVNSLTANLRMDLGISHPGVRITAVMPGPVMTGFHQSARHSDGRPMPQRTGPLAAQTADQVAAAVLAHIDSPTPAPEVYTNPVHGDMARRYLADQPGFEALVMAPH
jgi:short-subunit dehydrogenase